MLTHLRSIGGSAVSSTIFAAALLLAPKPTHAAPSLTVEPASLQFPAILVGDTASAIVTLTSTGDQPVTLPFGSIALAGTNPNQFQILAPTGDVTLPPGAHLDLALVYWPISGGTHTASLEVQPASGLPPLTCPLHGSAVTPMLQLGAEPLDFGEVQIGASSTLRIAVKVPASSVVPVDITGVTSTNPAFVIDLSLTRRHLGPGGITTVDVTFRPSQPTPERALINISVHGLDAPILTISARGTGYAPLDSGSPSLIPVAVPPGCSLAPHPRPTTFPVLLLLPLLALLRPRHNPR